MRPKCPRCGRRDMTDWDYDEWLCVRCAERWGYVSMADSDLADLKALIALEDEE